MGKVVYHGTFSEYPPHEYGHETFHVGTLASTDDRAADQIMGGEVEEPAIRQVHAYEISDDAPVSKGMWGDPHAVVYGEEDGPGAVVPGLGPLDLGPLAVVVCLYMEVWDEQVV